MSNITRADFDQRWDAAALRAGVTDPASLRRRISVAWPREDYSSGDTRSPLEDSYRYLTEAVDRGLGEYTLHIDAGKWPPYHADDVRRLLRCALRDLETAERCPKPPTFVAPAIPLVSVLTSSYDKWKSWYGHMVVVARQDQIAPRVVRTWTYREVDAKSTYLELEAPPGTVVFAGMTSSNPGGDNLRLIQACNPCTDLRPVRIIPAASASAGGTTFAVQNGWYITVLRTDGSIMYSDSQRA